MNSPSIGSPNCRELDRTVYPDIDRRLCQSTWTGDMDRLERLRPLLTQDAGGIYHRVDSRKRCMPTACEMHTGEVARALVLAHQSMRATSV